MKYYIYYGRFPSEVSKEEFYSKRRRKDAHESVCCNNPNGKVSSRWLKFY